MSDISDAATETPARSARFPAISPPWFRAALTHAAVATLEPPPPPPRDPGLPRWPAATMYNDSVNVWMHKGIDGLARSFKSFHFFGNRRGVRIDEPSFFAIRNIVPNVLPLVDGNLVIASTDLEAGKRVGKLLYISEMCTDEAILRHKDVVQILKASPNEAKIFPMGWVHQTEVRMYPFARGFPRAGLAIFFDLDKDVEALLDNWQVEVSERWERLRRDICGLSQDQPMDIDV